MEKLREECNACQENQIDFNPGNKQGNNQLKIDRLFLCPNSPQKYQRPNSSPTQGLVRHVSCASLSSVIAKLVIHHFINFSSIKVCPYPDRFHVVYVLLLYKYVIYNLYDA